mmetsp:Transcript_21490/g.46688  ORF Transcript_21490/g.46688 Transcript_21490/m.46688 type:complete len:186 (+) Transcript_21490:214-771(+)|eukprot:CAMPEP_0172320930 /NCGR_PEP_ID=MMETSP1058-20130122/41811_1 /TAXON_ID=83371 /ORGANISM="Detonula confervacea, Strain CCMP 353" /LENGTH=185 /DNA_ID=CAMNT_0013036291 /DNA_START=138 /DNA_END=698 /DNA_ORIENTATION=-
MPPHNLFDSDCQSISMGQLFNSLLSSSINTLTPMCNDSAAGLRVYSPTYPMNHEDSSAPPTCAKADSSCTPSSKVQNAQYSATSNKQHASLSVATSPDPKRPPLNPIKPRASFRNRKKFGLSINVPPSPCDPHQLPVPQCENPPPLISCSRNVDLRRKSLSERHFFRPVSDDDDEESSSTMEMKQ